MIRSRSGVSSVAAIALAVACASPLGAADAVSGTATLRLSFPAGATRAEHVGMCEIDFYNFADSSLQAIWMGDEQCGVSGLGGDLEPGGVVHGRYFCAFDGEPTSMPSAVGANPPIASRSSAPNFATPKSRIFTVRRGPFTGWQ